MTQLNLPLLDEPTARKLNIAKSPKKNGSARIDSIPYLEELGIKIVDKPQSIQFFPNSNELVHRWSPYVQGFSANFVQSVLDEYRKEYSSPIVFDPFAGSGTALVQAKLNGFDAFGVELNPLLHFVAQTKLHTWNVDPDKFLRTARSLSKNKLTPAPSFLKSKKHFNPKVLSNLEKLKGGIDNFEPSNNDEAKIKDLLLLAFSAILIDCSNLKRTPCLGYSKKKVVPDDAPFYLFQTKVIDIADDLRILQEYYRKNIFIASEVFLANSKTFHHQHFYDLVITSPPYMNGLDYVINYKIEMAWLNFAQNHKQLKHVKDEMVVCDNVSKGLIREFATHNTKYTNEWLEDIKNNIRENIERRGSYRRPDMPNIVHKYFDDMYRVMKPVIQAIRPNGRFILVIGDSLIADTYLPTDLMLARIGKELGMEIEKIEKARNRRSGQIRSYKLRETIVTLRKPS